ncbi:glycosyltransferase family 2 protein [Oscillatoria sp. CS-180]|uniref:glycosyltransferase family 2 protein n=1 Tax=Oscillatoria sp. CS-180 TaxID=3021720 RepID=UPI00232A8C3D|nr:glycosyltransferase family 2 protein [Oscillatoria sp. CS-180]MDB9525001.1 glycosyltransferase family 2 protein [Oscillatoria sp. CS-180]
MALNTQLPKVTIGIINFNGKSSLPSTIDAAKALNYPDFNIVVADNLSTDGSQKWLQEQHPGINCLCLDCNRGPAAARNAIFKATDAAYVLFLDNDIVLEADTLSRLMQVMTISPRIAACHPEICDRTDLFVHRYNGSTIHYLGALIPRPQPSDNRPQYELFDIVSGGALLVKSSAAEEIGYFDEDYFFNWEDGDFVARLTLAGYWCVNVPEAIVHHMQKPRGTSKAYYMVRNRWFFMLKLYDWKTLLLISPALLVFELSQAALLLIKGEFVTYWKANFAVLQSLPQILEKRRAFQALKKKQDKDWLHAGDVYVSASVVDAQSVLSRLMAIVFSLFSAYWRLVKPLFKNNRVTQNLMQSDLVLENPGTSQR